MIIEVLIAGILSILAFLAHAFVGDKEFKALKPINTESSALDNTWVQTRAGWHWISVDLLAAGLILITLSLNSNIPSRNDILLFISLYFSVTGIVWLVTVFLSKNNRKQILVIGQWIFCFLVSLLTYLGTTKGI